MDKRSQRYREIQGHRETWLWNDDGSNTKGEAERIGVVFVSEREDQ